MLSLVNQAEVPFEAMMFQMLFIENVLQKKVNTFIFNPGK